LEIGDIVLIEKSYAGEGVSKYYYNENNCCRTSNVLNKRIKRRYISSRAIEEVCCYTTEALFRETRELIEDLRKKGVDCIDMESSALLSVANFRHVNLTFLFCISDKMIGCNWIYNNCLNLRKKILDTFLFLVYGMPT
jgi:purine-nucleoside phosphorylase